MNIELDPKAAGVAFWVKEDVCFYWENAQYKIPAGFYSDGMSVPRFLWRFIGPQIQREGVTRAAVCHDYCYASHCVDRKTADLILEDLLALADYPWLKRKLVYWGVRIFGGSHWNEGEEK